jgi:6-phosphogluconolactonase
MSDIKARPLATQFDSGDALAAGVARSIADTIRDAVAQRGRAAIALSGGSTPRPALRALAREPLPWPQVTITLVDDRWVPPEQPRSNHGMLNETLLDATRAARFIPLFTGDADPHMAEAKVEAHLAAIPRPFDLVVLGLGDDGHTASLFPGGDRLADALDMQSGRTVMAMTAPGAPEPRITLTLSAILESRRILLMFAGAEKKAVYDAALKDGPVEAMPVRAVLCQRHVPLDVYYA